VLSFEVGENAPEVDISERRPVCSDGLGVLDEEEDDGCVVGGVLLEGSRAGGGRGANIWQFHWFCWTGLWAF